MKYLNWLRDNFNFVSLIAGLVLVATDQVDLGRILITQGAQ